MMPIIIVGGGSASSAPHQNPGSSTTIGRDMQGEATATMSVCSQLSVSILRPFQHLRQFRDVHRNASSFVVRHQLSAARRQLSRSQYM
jgi:hypothetical protein